MFRIKTTYLIIAVSTIFICTVSFVFGQKGGHVHSENYSQEITYYVKDGVKLSVENNTPLYLVGLDDEVQRAYPIEMATEWIERFGSNLGITDMSQLQYRFKREGKAGHVVRFGQILNDVPVYQAEVVVNMVENKVKYVANTFNPSVQDISTVPTLSNEEALELAKAHIRSVGNVFFRESKLMVLHHEGVSKLAYRTVVEGDQPSGSWETFVEAHDGSIIRSANKACYHDHVGLPPTPPPPANGSGYIFNPDPLSQSGSTYAGNYVDNDDNTNTELNAARISVTLLDIELSGGVYKLKGPYAEIMDSESPNNGLFTQLSSSFNFDRSDDGFEAVNCYYHVDRSMRYINTTLGMNLMPIQYSGGVRFDPSGLNGEDNSHYLGGSGSLAFGEGGVDDAEDADVIVHELGHGLHDWATGGNLSQVNGLSEGSGDYWAQSYSRALNQWDSGDPEYHWVFHWDGHNPFWGGRVTNYAASYPGGITGGIHADGQIWSTSLMRIFDGIGREATDLAFLEGLALTNGSSSQDDAANAVWQAAINMDYTCAQLHVIHQEFTNTGYTLPSFTGPPPPATWTHSAIGAIASFAANTIGDPTNWLWDFGDGNTSTAQNPTHAYAASGNYLVCLTATNACGTDSTCGSVSVCTSAACCSDTLLFEDFQSQLIPATWGNDDFDGNTDANGRPMDWFLIADILSTIPGDTNYVAAASSWFNPLAIANNVLTLDPVTVCDSDMQLIWKSAPWEGPGFADGYAVMIQAAGDSFPTEVARIAEDIGGGAGTMGAGWVHTNYNGTNGVLQEWSLPLAAYSGQSITISFHHDSNDDNMIKLDDIFVGNCYAPLAAFSNTSNNQVITFSDQSTLTPTSWAWDFGDGNTSILQNPTHTYSSAGTYTVCLIASNACGPDTSCETVTVVSPCENPTGQTVSDIQGTQVTVNWDAQPSAISYKLRTRIIGTSTWSTNTITAPTTFKVKTNLEPNSDYEYQLKTVCSENSPTGYGATEYFTTGDFLCDNPTVHSVTDITTTGATMHWNAVPNVNKYKVKIRESGTTTWSFHTIYAPDTLKVRTGLLPGTDYEYKVKTFCDYNTPPSWGTFQYFTTPTEGCINPTGQSASNVEATQATISWNTVPDALSYKLRIRKVGTTQWLSNIITAPTTFKVRTNLEPDTEYEYELKTVCAANSPAGYGVTSTFTTLEYPCDNPTDHWVSAVNPTGATMTWNSEVNAIKYKLKIRETGTSVWSFHTIQLPDTSKTRTGLLPSTDYEYKVKTVCAFNTPLSWGAMQYFSTPLARLAAQLDENNAERAINVFPNPTTGKVTVVLGGSEQAFITVRNIHGQIISKEMVIDAEWIDLELAGAKGLYTIEVITSNGTSDVFRVVKE